MPRAGPLWCPDRAHFLRRVGKGAGQGLRPRHATTAAPCPRVPADELKNAWAKPVLASERGSLATDRKTWAQRAILRTLRCCLTSREATSRGARACGGFGESQPQQSPRIAAGDGADGRLIEPLDRGDVPDRVVLRHVEGIVGTHDDAIGAEHAHEEIGRA